MGCPGASSRDGIMETQWSSSGPIPVFCVAPPSGCDSGHREGFHATKKPRHRVE